MVLSVSFLELGQASLTQGHAWVTIATARATGVIDSVVGGWSGMLRRIAENLLLGPHGLATAGLPLRIGGLPSLLYGKLTNILADGDGLRQGLDWRGASGLKPCIKHFNVFKKALSGCFNVRLCLTHTRPTALCQLQILQSSGPSMKRLEQQGVELGRAPCWVL